MFDLDRAVAEWKSEMGRGGVVVGADLEEVEWHLRESADRLMVVGLSPEEAFLVAARRLGGVDRLKLEYGKVRPEREWRVRVAWMVVGVLVWGALSSLSTIVTGAGLVGAVFLGLRGEMLGGAAIAADVVGLVMAILLATGTYRLARGGRMGGRPAVWVVAGVVAFVVGWLAGQMQMASIAYFVGPSELKQMVLVQSHVGMARALLMPIAFGVLAVRLRRNLALADC